MAPAQNLAIATGSAGAVTVSAEVGSSILVVFTTANGTISKPLTATGATQAVVLTTNDLTALGNGVVNVSATAAGDISGTSQSSTASFVIDTVAPAAAQLSVVATDQVVDILEQAQGVTFAGTAEAKAKIVVQWGTKSMPAIANDAGAWSALFASADVPADGARTATITVSDAANNVASSTATVQVAATPSMALTKGAEVRVTKDIFALSDNGVSPASTSITISGLTNGEFRKGSLAITQFTLTDVQDKLVTFVHENNSVNAPTFNVAVSDGTTSSSAKAAQIFFVPTNLAGLDDSLTGTTGSDLLIGGNGNDTIRGGQGNDVLYGLGSGIAQGLDNDIFVWGSGDAGLGAADVIRDFTAWNGTSGDKLDLKALLVGYQAGTSDISQWISVQNDVTLPGATGWDVGKTGTLLTIDIDGAGAGTVTQTIFLENVSLTTTNPNQLVSGGVILA
jgi:Ca2+-binding RTX toxin-like protein